MEHGEKKGGPKRRLIRGAAAVLLAVVAASVGWVVLYRIVPPPATPLMLVRWAEAGLTRDHVSIDAVSPHLVRAVIGAEDSKFCGHRGFDWDAIRRAWERNRAGEGTFGASTISMQTAKNAYLWPTRSYARKAAEAWFTVLIETLWPKRRIMEVYLNIAEWGDGLYGAQAAAQRYFGKSAADLTRREAALLAAVLPNPIRWSPDRPTRYIDGRARTIQARMAIVERDRLAACVLG